MADAQSDVKMVSGAIHHVQMDVDDLDTEILQILNGPSTEPGWRFIYVKDSRNRNLRLNVDHIESMTEG